MQPMSSQSFEAEIRKQIEEKKAQKLREQLIDQQLTLNHYKNYPLLGDGQFALDIDTREQQLQKMMQQNGLQLPSGVQNGVAFKGNMNQAPNNYAFDSKPANIFDDQFLRKINENHNFSNNPSSYPQQPDLSQMNERERRIFLRDKERERRNQVQSAGIATTSAQSNVQYGGGLQVLVTQKGQPDIFANPGDQILSKRDQIWAQKAMQRQNGLPPSYSLPPSLNQPSAASQQSAVDGSYISVSPVQNVSHNYKHPSHSAQPAESTPRTSMQALKLKQAIDLDTSVNKSLLQAEEAKQKQFIGFSLDQEEKRNLQNAQRKQEYNDLLVQQQQMKKPLHRDGSLSQSDQLMMGGLSQIGDHQYKQNDEKLRRQLEYKRMLEEQQHQKNQLKPPIDTHKQQLAEDLFKEVMKMKSPEQNNVSNKLPVGGVSRALSAVGSNRQQEMAKLQMQETNDPFFVSRNKEDVEKQRQLEKKREYAAELQQQMQQKKSEFDKAQELRSKVSRQPDQRLPIHQNQVFEQYPQPQPPVVSQYQTQSQEHYIQQYPVQDQFQYQGSQNDEFRSQFSQPQRQHENYYQEVAAQPAVPQQVPRNSKEEYRRQLENQMKEMNDKKQKQKEEQLKYEMKNDKDLADWISQKPDAGPSVRKGATDITRIPKQEDDRQINARLKYQEELRQQVEEQKQRKEILQRQAKMEDELDEQRYIQERERLAGRERQEIKQEGGKINDDKPKRQVRRDQFEPSQENPAFKKKQQQPVPELFQNSPPNPIQILKTPTSSALENQNNMVAFAQHDAGYPQQMPPVGKPQPFLLEDPQYPNTAFQVQPHPQHNYIQQPPTPFSYQLNSVLPSGQQFFNQQAIPNQTQSDWSQQQASKMFEDQQKMIQLYQQALEQILKYRNQYFEQAMEMRENILKEREQLLEFEKLKQQQMIEMQQIQAVKQQLGSVRANQQPLSANVQHNLDQYIVQQKQQILQMSQSQSQMQQLMSSQQPLFTVETSRVQIDKMRRDYSEERRHELMSPGAVSIGLQVAAQVDEIAEHIERIGGQNYFKEQDFEESLSSNTKLVKVPKNNLATKASQIKTSPLRASQNQVKEDQLLATWDEASLDKIPPGIYNHNVSSAKQGPFQRKQNQISELPEEDRMHSPVYKERKGMSDAQFNDRDSSDERNQQRTIDSHISRKKQLSTSGMIERKATITGSSFYDHTLKNQRQQAETQQAEMQKQLMRIFGNTQTSAGLVKVLDENLNHDDVETPSLHEIVETIDYGERDEELAPSEINIANTRTEHFQRNEESSNELGKNTSRFLNEGRASEYKMRGSQEFLLAQQEMMRSQQIQSNWEEHETVPVVSQNQNLQHTQNSNQMMSDFQVQEEDLAGGTINYLKMMNPDVLETQGTQKFQAISLGTQNKQLAQQLLTNSDEDFQAKDDHIEEEIYTSCDEVQTQNQYQVQQASDQKQQKQEILSKKEREIKEIEALIRKAQATTNNAVEQASRKKEQSKQKDNQKQKQDFPEPASLSDINQPPADDDTNILADLDRIINNLELQQKNMATFGIVDHYEDDDQEESKQQSSTLNAKPQRTQWRTLQEAREERPTTGKSTGKAPLVPKRQADDLSKSKISQRLADNSPNQRVGKFSQMALMNQTNGSDQSRDRSFNSKSPQRIGKYTQMAMDTSFKSKGSQNNSVSPSQTLGKFAQMALNQNQQDLSEDEIHNISQKYSRGPSKERDNSKSQSSMMPMEVGQAQSSILRPVSGSHSSRYQMPKQITANQRPLSTVLTNQNQPLIQQQQHNNTPGGQTTITSQKQQQYYFSDDEENGQTEGTQRFEQVNGFGQHQIHVSHRIVREEV